MKKARVGGVPEHFNLPWHQCIQNGSFKKDGVNLSWKDFPGGTGAMCKALRDNEIDIAIILTEGIVKDIIAGNPSKIVQTYIETPLIWGIHVGANSNYHDLEHVNGKKIAISRYGSGSHLMSYVNAQNNDWSTSDLNFEVVKNLDGAVEALTQGTADYFMWEHFTTKPLVDQGVFRRLGDCPTPWPCFVIAVRDEFLENNKQVLDSILNIINNQTSLFKSLPSINKELAVKYDQKIEDINEWLKITEWSQKQISDEVLDKVQHQLFELDILEHKVDSSQLKS